MKKTVGKSSPDSIFTDDNSSNIRKVMGNYKNVLICGIKGVGKITHTISAVKDSTAVYYIGNPVDYEGKRRPGSYEKYIRYISSLKADIKIIDDINALFKIRDKIILIVDEMYGRSNAQREQIGKLFEMENIQVFQIVGCMKYMGSLIDKIDIIVVLEHNGAFTIDKDFGKSICSILGKD
jgi:hypothetical protein